MQQANPILEAARRRRAVAATAAEARDNEEKARAQRRAERAAAAAARATRAREATRLRVDEHLSWDAIAIKLKYVSAAAAIAAAGRHGGFERGEHGVCERCGVSLPRIGRSNVRRFCDEHVITRRQELQAERAERRRAERSPRPCIDCGALLRAAGPGGQQLRCPEHAAARRRQRERWREQRRSTNKKAYARARGYTTRHWKAVRDEAVLLAGHCAHCGARSDLTGHLANENLQGDHRRATIADVEVLCRSCHGRR